MATLVLRDMTTGVSVPDLPAECRPTVAEPKGKRAPNAVIVLVDSGRITDGTPLEFRAGTVTEKAALEPWLLEDPRRGQATWVNNRGKPLLWAADGNRYSPSGLVKDVLRQVGQKTRAVQGTSRWFLSGEGSLVQLANQMRNSDE